MKKDLSSRVLGLNDPVHVQFSRFVVNASQESLEYLINLEDPFQNHY